MGLRICARALYDPRSAPEFFERLLEYSHSTGAVDGAEWRSTHPKTANRIENMRAQEEEAMQYYKRKYDQAKKNGKEIPKKRTEFPKSEVLRPPADNALSLN